VTPYKWEADVLDMNSIWTCEMRKKKGGRRTGRWTPTSGESRNRGKGRHVRRKNLPEGPGRCGAKAAVSWRTLVDIERGSGGIRGGVVRAT